MLKKKQSRFFKWYIAQTLATSMLIALLSLNQEEYIGANYWITASVLGLMLFAALYFTAMDAYEEDKAEVKKIKERNKEFERRVKQIRDSRSA